MIAVYVTLGSTATADCAVDDVVLQLDTTSGVVMQLNEIAESTCGNRRALVPALAGVLNTTSCIQE